MAIKWTPDLSVGVDFIDEQHKIWFEKVDQLFSAGQRGEGREYILKMFDFLDDYTKTHFRDEEQYMESINYPGLEEQKTAHNHFKEELARIRKEYIESGGNLVLLVKTNKMIVDWLVKHISHLDKKIGEFVAARKE
ncbi:hemerythrin-like metal-binding protein [Thermoclostridium stercorarium subsp. stercorarium DSM 8532]|uniref:Hemerythrin-like metal-binding protein n=3 Tax=Thermoclostridium stercorarium TaxID=1510 RepID=L7VKF1_THES1|nr:hemerythrin family protein [Thermoclostridium stercorarium]AGC67217.1 hemerythrin-like metal-binding protein [Thermoclostridium stercorarium subsp. stercorarium DSM 8532]AGI38291.1 metal-binding domain-containing protein [Thermoclostridium stercorarium subsp. stercorarium DSM 8532]ANW97682.1 hemerythrin [Thermoclostridium stercorarium subsp. thermolacticum DSM 2910]ANX00245.1 hemerythrin [Thermoclostridium stercorarium subsp. leptospartum DSM 9219]UZQ85807.1 hemerythrin family protein [Ther